MPLSPAAMKVLFPQGQPAPVAPARPRGLQSAADESIYSKLADAGTGAVGRVGNLLDVPGSMSRGLIAKLTGTGDFGNVFAGLGSPTTDEGRISGRDQLERWGAFGPNTPGLDWGDVAGFGYEVATDPLTWTPAGFLGKVAKLATKTPILGPLAVKGAKAIRYNPLVNHPLRHLDAGLRDTVLEPLQKASKSLTAENELLRQANNANLARRAQQLHKAGYTEDVGDQLRRSLEATGPVPTGAGDVVSDIHGLLPKSLQEQRNWGMKTEELLDPHGRYFPRSETQFFGQPGARQAFSARHPSQLHRKKFLRDIPEMTGTIKSILMDPTVEAAHALGPKAHRAAVDAVAAGRLPDVDTFAKWAYKMPEEQRKIGFFGNDPLTDMFHYEQRSGEALNATKSAVNVLADFISGNPETVDPIMKASAKAPGMTKLASFFKGINDVRPGLGVSNYARLQPAVARAERARLAALGMAPADIATQMKRYTGRLGDLHWYKDKGLASRSAAMGDFNTGVMDQLRKALILKTGKPVKLKDLSKLSIPDVMAKDMERLIKGFDVPDPTRDLGGLFTSGTNLNKFWQTGPWPGFHFRNRGGGATQNILAGLTGPLTHFRASRNARAILTGKPTKGLLKIPAISDALNAEKLPLTEANAADMLRRMSFQGELTGGGGHGEFASLAGGGEVPMPASFEGILKRFPGGLEGKQPIGWSDIPKALVGPGTWKPLDIPGVGGRTTGEFKLHKAGAAASEYVEGMNRLEGLIGQLMKGVDLPQALERVKSAQVDYAGRKYTPFEREVMTRLIPYYKFQKGMLPFVTKELWNKPGGRLGQFIRASRHSTSGDPQIPGYIREGLAVALPESWQPDPETRRLIGQLGLMHESPLALFPGSQTLPELASQLNPILKAPLELAGGHSFFQHGPMGPRELSDADPPIARTVSNIHDLITGEKTDLPEPFFGIPGGQTIEHLASNLPTSRAVSTLRGLADPRGYRGDIAGVKPLLNFLTGVKIRDVSPEQAERNLLEEAFGLTKQMGGKEFTTAYFPKAIKQAAEEGDPERAAQITAIQRLLSQVQRQRRQRKKAAAP